MLTVYISALTDKGYSEFIGKENLVVAEYCYR